MRSNLNLYRGRLHIIKIIAMAMLSLRTKDAIKEATKRENIRPPQILTIYIINAPHYSIGFVRNRVSSYLQSAAR
jgi:hypothetical protein